MTATKVASDRSSSASLRRWGRLVYLLFFLSGATSLIYEVLWVRKFGLVFGVTTYAVSTVLAAFFAGLALGSYVAGRAIDRTRLHPLAIYGVMEGLVGIWALLLPWLLRLVEAAYPFIYARVGESFGLFTLFRFLASFAVLVVPTTLMGATLPVLSKLMVDREEVLGLSVGRLYAVNTFGAVTGTFSAGFLLVPHLGLLASTLVAALGNFLLAGAALALSTLPAFAPSERRQAGPEEEAQVAALTRDDRLVLLLAFTSGLAALALEVVWTRSLVLILGSTTYAFSTMLTAVLVGIAAGSAAFAPLADSTRNRGALVAGLLFVGGLCAAMGPAIINALPFAFLRMYDWTSGVWGLAIATQFAVCFALVFIPTFLSGASFPILVKMYSRGAARVGRTVADVYAINTLGGILGSLIGGFVLVRFLGLQPSLTTAALFLMLVGGPAAMMLARPWQAPVRVGTAGAMVGAVALLGFVHPRFDTKLLFGGWGPYAGGYYVSRMGTSTVDKTGRYMQRLLYHKEGVTASVDVLESGSGDKIISINAKPVATTYLYDMRALKMLGHLPVLLHPDPRDVLIIGLGAGVSSGIIASYPAVRDVTIVELCSEVPGGARQFAEWNHDVLDNPKVRVVINDGANYVKATRRKYDVISADPIHPFVTGAGNLYSYEHWQNCKARLKEGGILAQWLPLYQLSPTDFAMIIRTFVSVFPNATIWYSGIDTVLVGCNGPFKIDPDRMGEHMAAPGVTADLLSMGVHQVGDILGWFVAGPDELREIGQDAPCNRIDRPLLEFSAPKSVSLSGVASTTPALLTALDRTSGPEMVRQLAEMSTRPLDAATLQAAEATRQANRWLMRSQVSYSYGYVDEYLEGVRRALEQRPRDRFIERALADAEWEVANQQWGRGLLREAYERFMAAYRDDPLNASALAAAAGVALQLGDLPLAQSTLEMAAPDQLDIFDILVRSGQVALARGDWEGARRAFEAAGRGKDGHWGQESPEMHVGLGVVALHEGQRALAREHFDRALNIATDSAGALHDIVDLCVAHGFAADARSYAEQLVGLAESGIASDPGTPLYYDYRALAYSALGEDRKAERDRATADSLSNWWEEPASAGEPAAISLP